MRGLRSHSKRYAEDYIYIYENEKGIVYVYNSINSVAFSLSKNYLVHRLKGKLCLSINDKIDSLSRSETNLIVEELGLFCEQRREKKTADYKVSIKLFDLIDKIPFHNLWLKVVKVLVLYLAFPIFLMGLLVSNVVNHSHEFFDLNSTTIIVFLVCLIGSIVFHELAHAFVAIDCGAFVPEMGFKLKKFRNDMSFPIFYTSIIGKQNLGKSKEIKILIAGPFANMLLAGVGLILYSFNSFFYLLIILNVLMIFTNFTAFDNSDAYKVLERTFERKNLSKETWEKVLSSKTENKKMDIANIIYLILCLLSVMFYMIMGIFVLYKI